MRLEGRSAIVTGGAVGIGKHYSYALAAEGAQVMIADIKDGTAVAEEISAKYGRNSTAHMQFDVSDEAQCKALVAKTLERFGKIDILVNNAAIYAPLAPLAVTDIDVDLWDKVMSVNVRGPFLMAKHVAPHMIARKYGKIINIGSGTAARGIPDFAHYVTSKGAVTSFTRAVSRELGEHGICVNTLAPGFTHQRHRVTNTGPHRPVAGGRDHPPRHQARTGARGPRGDAGLSGLQATAISSPARSWRSTAGPTIPRCTVGKALQTGHSRCGSSVSVKTGRNSLYVPAQQRPTGPAFPRRIMDVRRTTPPTPSTTSRPSARPIYDKISKHDMAPLWEVLASVVTKEPKTKCVPRGLEIRRRQEADARGR